MHRQHGDPTVGSRVEILRALFAASRNGASRPSDPEAELLVNAPFQAWSTAVQLATAAFTLGCRAYDKVATRRWIDSANELTKALLNALANAPTTVLERLPQQLPLVSAAVALELMFYTELPPYQERNIAALMQRGLPPERHPASRRAPPWRRP